MATRIVAKLHGEEWVRPLAVFQNSKTGEIEIRSEAPDPEAAVRKLACAYEMLLRALQSRALVATVEANGRWLNMTSNYWNTASGYNATREGRIMFTGGAMNEEAAQIEGRPFFVEEPKFQAWLEITSDEHKKSRFLGQIIERLQSSESAGEVLGQYVIAAMRREPSYETVPLGGVQIFHSLVVLEFSEHLFREGLLRVSGLRSDNGNRELIDHPRDWEIEWPGAKPRGDYDSEAYAKRPFEWGQHDHPYLYKDLEISRSAWNALEALIQSPVRRAVIDDAVRQSEDKRIAYEQRIAKFKKDGKNPPLETTKAGTLGDREWAVENGVPRDVVEGWRAELLATKRGRPKNSAGNSAGK